MKKKKITKMHNLNLTKTVLKNNNYKKTFNKQTNKQTYSLSVLIISYNVRWEVKQELICFVHFIRAVAMIWLLMRTRVFGFIAYTQSPVRTVTEVYVCTAFGRVFVCVAYC